jgi:hypothetical protein
MSYLVEFYVPDDDILRELGRLQIRHSHLDLLERDSQNDCEATRACQRTYRCEV